MTRYILIVVALLSIDPISGWLADRRFNQQHERHRYDQSDIAAVGKLIEREMHPIRQHHAWTGEEKRLALKDLGWEVMGE